MEIVVRNYQTKFRPKKNKIIDLVRQLADRCGTDADAVSVVLVDDRRMAQLNKKFTGRAESTDVLSFQGDKDPQENKIYLGDIVISTGRAEAQARDRDCQTGDEIKFLLIHGFLHLLGYNHTAGQKKMRRLEKKLFEELEIEL